MRWNAETIKQHFLTFYSSVLNDKHDSSKQYKLELKHKRYCAQCCLQMKAEMKREFEEKLQNAAEIPKRLSEAELAIDKIERPAQLEDDSLKIASDNALKWRDMTLEFASHGTLEARIVEFLRFREEKASSAQINEPVPAAHSHAEFFSPPDLEQVQAPFSRPADFTD